MYIILLMAAHREVDDSERLFHLLSRFFFHGDHVADEIGGGCDLFGILMLMRRCWLQKTQTSSGVPKNGWSAA